MRAPRSVGAAQLLLGLGGMLLLVSLFLDWYEPGLSAWTVFEVLDLVLAALALVGIWALISGLFLESQLSDDLFPIAAGVAFVVVLSQLVNHPPAAQGGSPQRGAWLGLAGSGLMLVGAALGTTRISLGVSLSPRREEEDRGGGAAAEAPRRQRPSPSNEAAALEPEVHEELYPEHERRGPIGADDPELWTGEETLSFDPERREGS